MNLRFCPFALLLALASGAPMHAQLSWSVFDETTLTPVAGQASDRVSVTVPPGQRVTLISTGFVPFNLTAAVAPAVTVSLNFTVSGGLATLAAGTRAIGFGLFDQNGTGPVFTDDAGYFVWLNGRATGSLIELRRRNGNGPSPSLLNPTGASFANLGTGSATQTAGALTDGVPYAITLRLNRVPGGISLGSGTATDTAGVWIRGDGLSQTAFTNPDNPPAATQFNQLAFMFLNTTAAPVTLTLDTVTGVTAVSIPVITAQPQQLILNPNQPGTLTVSATGTPPLTYQWRKDGIPLSSGSGASLTVSAATNADAGVYSVIVSNVHGSAISSAAPVIISSTPVPATIDTQPQSLTVSAGQPAVFSVNAFGSAPLVFEWQKSSVAIPGASGSTYAISSATPADAGVYSVVVRNAVTSVVSNPVTLTVNSPPVIATQPVSLTVNAGQAAQFTVAATGSGPFTYQWLKDGAPLSGAASATLAFASVTAANLGSYTVRVANSTGSVVSNAAVLTTPSTLAITARFPAAGATAVNPDTPLRLTFDRPVQAGGSGRIRILRASDHTVVETLDLGAAPTRLVGTNPTPYRFLPVIASGNTVTIHPRAATLAYNQSYYVTMESGAILDATGASFTGIADAGAWRFTTRNAGPLPGTASVTVAADGTGDFSTVQGAIDFVPAGNTARVIITVRRGTYPEINYIGSSKPFITIRGEDRTGTIIAYPNNNTFNSGNNRAMFSVDANDFTLETITLRNTTPRGGSQAEAIRGNGQRAVFNRVNLSSFQDTLLWNGALFVTDSFIEGDVDFMWGSGAGYFQRCELKMLSSGGFYTQVRNGQTGRGNVYVDCRLTAAEGVTGAYLARIDPRADPALTSGWPYSQVVFLNCTMGAHVAREGWRLDNATSAPNVQFWEYRSTDVSGATLEVSGRLGDSRQINDTTAAQFRDPVFVVGFSPPIAPAIETAPVAQSALAGSNVRLTVTATGAPAPGYQWLRGGQPMAGATAATLVLANVQPTDAGDYLVRVSNAHGTVSTPAVPLTIARGKYAGVYFGTGAPAGTFALHVRDDGGAVFAAVGTGASGVVVTRTVAIDADGRAQFTAGGAAVELTLTENGNVTGRLSAGAAVVTLAGSRGATAGATQAFAGYFLAGTTDGAATVDVFADASGRAFLLASDNRGGVGTLATAGQISAGGISGTIAANGASVTINPSAAGAASLVGAADRVASRQRLTGLSTRAQAGAGSSATIVGFVVSGEVPKPVLVRAVGPTLAAFGVGGVLPAPKLELFRGQTVIASNAGWGTSPNAGEITNVSAQVGLFALAAGSADSALLITLAPGGYTAVMTDVQGRTGNGLVEIYDLAADDGTQRLAKLSARAFVGAGDATLIAGMTVAGGAAKRVLIRAAGPTLAALGVTDALARPTLTLLEGTRVVAQNSAWSVGSDGAQIAAVAAQVGAFAFANGSADAALLLSLPPGNYTAQITGAGGTSGVALVEVYELP